MVYELKPPVDDSPGLLMFTHKERPYFLDPPPALERRIRRLKERYVLGLQWGAYHEDVGATPFVDFQMACPGTVQFRADADVRHVPLCSRDFTPDRFRPMDVPTRWDVLSVGHPIRIKRMSELLDVVRMCYDAGHKLDVLLVCAIPDAPARLTGYWDTEFFEKYREQFTDAEREHIQLAAPIEAEFGDRPLHPIPNEVFPYLYNASSGFALFSKEEGQSKVIHEALCCGTPVVVREGLRGGGRDHLDDTNSLQFGTLAEARDAFIALHERGEELAFDPTDLRRRLCESYTVRAFERELERVYADLGHELRGELETTDLAFKLGGHTLTLRPELRSGNTNDLRSRRAFLVYAGELLGREAGVAARLAARRADASARLTALREGGVEAVAAPLLAEVERHTPLPAYTYARKVRDRL